jgi:hypothetical protein
VAHRMSPATTVTLPVRMRVGDGEEVEVGTITLDLTDEAARPELPDAGSNLAALLRAAAAAVEEEGDSPT